MKIAIAVQPWDRVVSGVAEGSSIALIAYQLASRLADRHELHIIANRGPGQPSREIDSRGITIHRIAVPEKPGYQLADRVTGFWNLSPPLFARPAYYPRYAHQLARIARDEGIEILHLTTFAQHAEIARRYLPQACIVLHMHDETLSLLPADCVEPRLASIDCFVGVSEFITNRFRQRFPGAADRCITVHNGVDPNRFHPLPVNTRDVSPRILYVGRISPEKGVQVLLEAFASVVRAHPDCQLDIVGMPGLLPYALHLGLTKDATALKLNAYYGDSLAAKFRLQLLRKNSSFATTLDQLTNPKIKAQVHYHGALPNEALLTLYNQATVLVFPSVWNEPFGMPVTEAMACGLPVVASDSGAIPELVHHEQSGLIVPRGSAPKLAAALSRVLSDPATAHRMGECGRQQVLEHLTFDHAATALEHQYQQMASSKSQDCKHPTGSVHA